jgi:hypothetical protein
MLTGDRSPKRARKAYAAAAIVVIAAALFALFLTLKGGARAPSEDALLEGAPAKALPERRPSQSNRAPGARGPTPPREGDEEGNTKDLRERRLARAQETLDNYLASTKYPPEARPLSEQAGQEKPHHVPPRKLPLARDDKKLTDARVTLKQDRLYLSGDESVTLLIACETSEGPAPCEVLSSIARSGPFSAAKPDRGAQPPERSSVVTFQPIEVPEGAGEGLSGSAMRAVFTPSAQGFEGHHGPIGIFMDLRVEGEEGRTGFDIEYTPAPPAVFTGQVREALEEGSLILYVGVRAEKAGRYVIQARVDDASGRSFALLSFNDELPSGLTEAKLPLFGKLILDEKAEAPFRLRDVEGFLLKENVHPDRELMPTHEGVLFTSKAYTPRDFSDSEWQSEERERHVNEYKNDVDKARRALESGVDP